MFRSSLSASNRKSVGQSLSDEAWLDLNIRSEEHTSELQSHSDLVCRLLLEKKKKIHKPDQNRTGEDRTIQQKDDERTITCAVSNVTVYHCCDGRTYREDIHGHHTQSITDY